jgi:hypothetical protein
MRWDVFRQKFVNLSLEMLAGTLKVSLTGDIRPRRISDHMFVLQTLVTIRPQGPKPSDALNFVYYDESVSL